VSRTGDPRRYDADAARADILAAAMRLFAAGGFERTSVAAIAREAGVSPSQINYHFGTKEKLWVAVHREALARYYRVQMELIDAGPPGEERLRNSMTAYFRFFQENPDFARMMTWNLMDPGRIGGGEGDVMLEFGVRMIRRSQEEGHLRDDVHPAMVLLQMLGAVSWWFQARERFGAPMGLEGDLADHDEDYLETAIRIFTSGVVPGAEGEE